MLFYFLLHLVDALCFKINRTRIELTTALRKRNSIVRQARQAKRQTASIKWCPNSQICCTLHDALHTWVYDRRSPMTTDNCRTSCDCCRPYCIIDDPLASRFQLGITRTSHIHTHSHTSAVFFFFVCVCRLIFQVYNFF